MNKFDVIIIGAGAAGMMCAIEAGNRGRSVLVLERSKKPGEKIRISGGGRCNFTNLSAGPDNYLSANSKFSISALSRFTQQDFVDLVDSHGIAWHEKTLGQIFCDGSARQIVDMLLEEMLKAGVELRTNVQIDSVSKIDDGFAIDCGDQLMVSSSVIVACGGKSIPKMGATNFGYRLASQFDIKITYTSPALVPLTFDQSLLDTIKPLAGISLDVRVSCNGQNFQEAMLLTHRGLSGPAILQISSYWREGLSIQIDLLPDQSILSILDAARTKNGKRELSTILSEHLPNRLAQWIGNEFSGRIADMTEATLTRIGARLHNWTIKPIGTEGYRTAEVTLGGVDTNELNAKTLQSKLVPGLYFIGEIVDVTGWLGGYNFQWAWSSGWAAGQVV